MLVEVISIGKITGMPLVTLTFHLFFRIPGSLKTTVWTGIGAGAGEFLGGVGLTTGEVTKGCY